MGIQAGAGAGAGTRLVVFLARPGANPQGHECRTQRALAQRVAALHGYEYGGDYDAERHQGRALYFVPGDTLDIDTAAQLGVQGELDLFGGVVPHAFVATKTITHPLVRPDAIAPPGWAHDFAEQVRDVVLPGYAAFSLADAREAGMLLLPQGPVRLKLATGVGGLGQAIAASEAELDEALQAFERQGGIDQGVVLEANMHDLATYSAGRAVVGDLVVTYYGAQRLTRNNAGKEVYGGSDLVVVRGDFGVLLQRALAPHLRMALEQASVYHRSALQCYPGLCASRCNYDIAQGRDHTGRWRSGVLEQSWRIGGASGAELAAIQAFMHDAALQAARASTTERYGEVTDIPDDATIYYSDSDPRVGMLTKYARIEAIG